MTLIWIISSDISFAVDLKKAVVSELARGGKKGEVRGEIMESASFFLNRLKKKKKQKGERPRWIFLVIPLPDEEGLPLYADLIRTDPDAAEAVVFCSAMNYGAYAAFFEEQGLSIPPFFPKSHAVERVGEWLRSQTDSPKSKPASFIPKIPMPLFRRGSDHFQSSLERLKEMYYGTAVREGGFAVLREGLVELAGLAQKISLSDVAQKTERLLELMDQATPAGQMRLRREFKELLILAEKRGKEIS